MTPEELYKIILQIDENWEVSSITLEENVSEVHVNINYIKSRAIDPLTGADCHKYDHREERCWRH